MASNGRQMTPTGRATLIVLLALAAALAIAALAAPANADVVYESTPAPAAEPASLGFAETGTAELGSLARLAGAARLDPVVRFEVVAAACDAEPAAAVCAIPDATFALPATLSVYAVGPEGVPGQLLARQAQTFQLSCDDAAQPLAFALAGVTLPAEAIFSLAFDTSAGGYQPSGVVGPADTVAAVLAGPPAAGTNPREAEGVYRAATPAEPGAMLVFGFEAEPATWEGRQPAFTVEAAAAPGPVAAAAAAAPTVNAATTTPSVRPPRREYRIPASKRMTLSFTRATARIAGPGALVQVRCTGSSAARCIGTLSLSVTGSVHKAPFSISKGKRQYVVVPLGDDLRLLGGLDPARATATASTVQLGGAAVTTKRALKLK
jgi:hypothetical protein